MTGARAVAALTALGLIVATAPAHAAAADTPRRPSDLVGMWKVTGPNVRPGVVLRMDTYEATVYRRCGGVDGGWRALPTGEFIADIKGGDGSCFPDGAAFERRLPKWLLAATRYRSEGTARHLRNREGKVVAILRPGGRVEPSENRIDELTEPPKVSRAQLRALDRPPAPLPKGLTPATRAQLLGRWVPDVPAADPARHFVRFSGDRAWVGSDGCNSEGGRWTVRRGRFLATSGFTTLVGCDNINSGAWVSAASSVGFDGAELVLVGSRGRELGRLVRG